MQPKRIGMVCRGRAEDITLLGRLINALEEQVEVILDAETAAMLKRPGMKIGEMDVDLLVCIGGDGTILRALHALQKPTPILGINMGAIGFLAEVQPEESVSVLTRLLEGFEVEQKERLAVRIQGVKEEIPYAMNEAVVITSKPGKMLHFAIFIDGLELEKLRADGVIFATPTGSTAYAMSAGGPIVDPQVDATIIVPIAPFKLSARPTVVDIQSEISFALLELKDAELVVDGQFYRPIGKGERISITRGEPALFVRIWNKHFLKLRDKLRSEEGR
ncbi:MAG: NAD(+) kinase [Methanophagales archaeon ANME-1-THS]|nr:MAG: NAD(+) kinase [Methanophagales archaeon ANME-1-THS]